MTFTQVKLFQQREKNNITQFNRKVNVKYCICQKKKEKKN